mmetsp:Transcript_39719/g.100714  ORF Transcript_39719/g.100714 Transcript_39719/m.100714 type:complete len:126 (+) Transcript_39719:916-1293(+)
MGPAYGGREEPAGAPGDMPYREKCARHVAQTERALFVLFKKAVLQHLVLWQGASDSEAGSSDEEERVSESCEEEDAEGGEGEGGRDAAPSEGESSDGSSGDSASLSSGGSKGAVRPPLKKAKQQG